MPTRFVSPLGLAAASLVVVGLSRSSAPPAAQVSLDLTTLHAAALSSARNPGDTSDAPYLLVSVVGPEGRKETMALPRTGHWALHLDQAIGETPISTLGLAPGDSVRVLLTVLEDREPSPQELPVATATTAMLADRKSFLTPPVANLSTTLAPLISRGANWLGSASLLLTNVDGTTYWTSLDCVSTCSVVRSPARAGTPGAVLQQTRSQPETGVVELSGAKATYHLQIGLRRVQ